MTQTGVIRESLEDGFAQVRITQRTACGHSCEDCGGCAAGSREVVVRARNPLEAKRGDLVTVSSKTGKVLGAAAVVYVLPLALMLVSALVCALVGGSEGDCAVVSLLALAFGAGLAVLAGRRLQRRAPVEYVITERLSNTVE